MGATSTVDTDGDAKADAFRVPIEVTVSNPGTWHVVLDLSQDGELVLSAPGTTELQAGSGVVNVDIGAEDLFFVGANGTFEVTNVVLADWSGEAPWMAAHLDSLGRTGSFRLSEISLPRPTQGQLQGPRVVLGRPTSKNVDTDKDGRFDILRFSGHVNVDRGGDYLLTAWLVGPTGQLIATHEETVALAEGRPSYQVDFPGELIGAYGSGRYTMSFVKAILVSDVHTRDEVKGTQTDELKASQWIGGQPNVVTLAAMWQAAQHVGAFEIEQFGFFVIESHRLERVERLIGSNDVAGARGELDIFLTNVRQAPGIARPWRDRVVEYATKVRGVL